jgi:hypothetical protein
MDARIKSGHDRRCVAAAFIADVDRHQKLGGRVGLHDQLQTVHAWSIE